MKHILGAHTSTLGGTDKAIELAESLGFATMQIFTKNNTRWNAKALDAIEIENYKDKLSKTKISPVISHDSYLINLCAPVKEILEKSREAFIDELIRCDQLDIEYLNFHPGSHGGQGEQDGIKIISESINIAHDRTKNFRVKSMLELTAGQGAAIGYRFEQIRQIIDGVEDKERMCVCIDTAHIFAAGYELRDPKGYEETFRQFDEIIGLDLLKCFHVNDSKKDLGTRVDRHTHIGEGFIGLAGFTNLMNDPRLAGIPMILETPKTKGQPEDVENLKILRSLIIKPK
ncbi:MAG: deoxyribonuclease IV [Ignavibacteria bacterium]